MVCFMREKISLTVLAALLFLALAQTPDDCAATLPAYAETCRTLSGLLDKVAIGYGAGAARVTFHPLRFENMRPDDPSRLDLLPLLRWENSGGGWPTSVANAACWVERGGAVLRCAFDDGTNGARAAERFDELSAVLQALVPSAWQAATTPFSALFSDGPVVRAAVHRANFAAANWVDDSPNARWKVVLSFGDLGRE
jgi:hypothetical protein